MALSSKKGDQVEIACDAYVKDHGGMVKVSYKITINVVDLTCDSAW